MGEQGNSKVSFLIEAIDKASGPIEKVENSFKGLKEVAKNLGLEDIIKEEPLFNHLRALGQTDEAVEKLQKTISDFSAATSLPHAELLTALENFTNSGGTTEQFEKDLATLGTTIQILGGHADEAGRLIAVLERNMKIDDPAQLTQAMA